METPTSSSSFTYGNVVNRTSDENWHSHGLCRREKAVMLPRTVSTHRGHGGAMAYNSDDSTNMSKMSSSRERRQWRRPGMEWNEEGDYLGDSTRPRTDDDACQCRTR